MDENAVTPTVHMVPQAAVRQLSDQWVQSNAENDMSTLRNWITSGLVFMGFSRAACGWTWLVCY
ncbi:hypothetical protein C2845_PM11G06460 [Panicum miliaceum]|uniref:Uncharacterized protein n=1 Tax=Panicum miliaceum TaxID=4540 RepID=A0A3L6RMK3_PANMI|nr:hypothetical protein C2845_PM11G06460 [Panicum miliaceum]